MTAPVELRRAKRYRLAAPTTFLWVTEHETSQSGEGTTRDINTSGVYVFTDSLPPVGARIQMAISLPGLTETGFGMHLQGQGIVIRGELGSSEGSCSRQAGFAASVQFYPETDATVLSRLESSGRVN